MSDFVLGLIIGVVIETCLFGLLILIACIIDARHSDDEKFYPGEDVDDDDDFDF